jgi:hypothetical protein
MDKAVEDFRKAMAGVRTGRASVHMLDGVTVDYYGSQMPLEPGGAGARARAAADYGAAFRCVAVGRD